jgi:hypothetical protein
MTYRDLLEKIQSMTEDQLNSTVTVQEPFSDDPEFLPATDFIFSTKDNDVLDEGHPVIVT